MHGPGDTDKPDWNRLTSRDLAVQKGTGHLIPGEILTVCRYCVVYQGRVSAASRTPG